MTIVAVIGSTALFLLYGWLASAIIASYLSGKKGYGERIGLASGLLLAAVGVVIWVVMPTKPTSDWGRRKAARRAARSASAPAATGGGGQPAASSSSATPDGGGDDGDSDATMPPAAGGKRTGAPPGGD